MNLNPLALLFTCSALLFSCNTVSTQATSTDDNATKTDTDVQDSTWYNIASSAESIDMFMTAVNNIIITQDFDTYMKVVDYNSTLDLVKEYGDQSNRNRNKIFSRFQSFSDKIGAVCGDVSENDWILVRTRVEPNMQSGFMDYRIELDDTIIWCTLSVEKIVDQFKVTSQFNHYYHFGTLDLVRGFIELDSNAKINFQPNSSDRKSFYTEIAKGLTAFDTYLRVASANSTLPLVHKIRLDLIDDIVDIEEKQNALSYYVKKYGMSTLYPIQQLILDLEPPIDSKKLQSTVEMVETITGDRSQLKLIVASRMTVKELPGLTDFYLQNALLAEPTNANIYFNLFDWKLEQKEYAAAIQSLQVLVENFGYEFEREDFLKNDFYNDLVKQPVFNDWLPKT